MNKAFEQTHGVIKKAPNATLIVDFDETLFLRNSTEAWLDQGLPRTLAAIFYIVLKFIKPWRLFGGDVARDWCRLNLTRLLLPWTPLVWQKYAAQIAQDEVNQPLAQLIKDHQGPVIIATLGFSFVVKPLLKHMDIGEYELLACQSLADRKRGKLAMLQAELGEQRLAEAILVTDSEDDRPVLDVVAHPCLVQWEGARTAPAMEQAYLPFLYLEKGKRPGSLYFAKVVIADDWFLLVLACSWLSPSPILHAFSMLLLMLSFWCVYEIGYWQNDRVAATLEADPVLSATYEKYQQRMKPLRAWVWAAVFAVPGTALMSMHNLFVNSHVPNHWFMAFVLWMMFLGAVACLFCAYNYFNKQTRVWLFLPLQLCKTFGFLILTSSNVVGVFLFIAQAVARWVPYIVRRFGQTEVVKTPVMFLRLILFITYLIGMAINENSLQLFLEPQVIAIVLWLILRARKQTNEIVKKAEKL